MTETMKDYLVAAIWTGSDGDGDLDEFTIHQFSPESQSLAVEVIEIFVAANADDVVAYENELGDNIGHDLWLTRNGHGAGFWDRGLGELGERLTKAAHDLGESYVEVGDDGKLYLYESNPATRSKG